MTEQRYVVALGSNQPHHRFGRPEAVLAGALERMQAEGWDLLAASRSLRTAPLGPSRRRYANAAALIACDLMPDALLTRLKAIERAFGRRPGGRRWQARTLDLDIILWSGGAWTSAHLTVPHVAYRDRAFVLRPILAVAHHWRDPLTGLTPRHLEARLTGRCPVPIARPHRALSSVGRATDF